MRMHWEHPSQHLQPWHKCVRAVLLAARKASRFLSGARERPTMQYSELTIHGWRLLHDGRHAEAKRYFRAALQNDPYSVGAWLGLSRAVDTREDRLACLQVALKIQHDFEKGSCGTEQ